MLTTPDYNTVHPGFPGFAPGQSRYPIMEEDLINDPAVSFRFYEHITHLNLLDFIKYTRLSQADQGKREILHQAMIEIFAYTSHKCRPYTCHRHGSEVLKAVKDGLLCTEFGNYTLALVYSGDEHTLTGYNHTWTELVDLNTAPQEHHFQRDRLIIDFAGMQPFPDQTQDYNYSVYQPFFGSVKLAPGRLSRAYTIPVPTTVTILSDPTRASYYRPKRSFLNIDLTPETPYYT